MYRVESPRTDDAAIEQEINAKGLTAPRVTPADIEANIASEYYFTAGDGVVGVQAIRDAQGHSAGDQVSIGTFSVAEPLELLTFCVLVLRNGFTVIGESACASPQNFDAELGRKIARANAVNKVWPLMGYALKERLASAASLPFDLTAHLRRQIDFSARTFGPGDRLAGVCDHIRKELREVQDAYDAGMPTLPEWVDVIILAFDGAWRTGASPEQIVAAIVAKQVKNEGRIWPDWRTAKPGKAIEHDRTGEQA